MYPHTHTQTCIYTHTQTCIHTHTWGRGSSWRSKMQPNQSTLSGWQANTCTHTRGWGWGKMPLTQSSVSGWQANCIDSLITWHNPLGNLELRVPDEDKIAAWRATNLTEKQWRETAAFAWEISPTLAVGLPSRWVAALKCAGSCAFAWLFRCICLCISSLCVHLSPFSLCVCLCLSVSVSVCLSVSVCFSLFDLSPVFFISLCLFLILSVPFPNPGRWSPLAVSGYDEAHVQEAVPLLGCWGVCTSPLPTLSACQPV